MTVALLLGGALVVSAAPASADYVYCPPNNGACVVMAGTPGGGGGGGGSGGGGVGTVVCRHHQLGVVSCYRDGYGWYNQLKECYYEELQLAPTDPLWDGHDPYGGGHVYAVRCWEGGGAGWIVNGYPYLPNRPPGWNGPSTTLTLAARAINAMWLRGPMIDMAPRPSGSGLVGLPVWLYTPRTSGKYRMWGSYSATAEVPGLSVTAYATSRRIDWSMGDGLPAIDVRCANNGTKYDKSYGDSIAKRTCGYTYKVPSRRFSGGRFTVTGVTIWEISWEATNGFDSNGTFLIQRSASVSVRINELQAVTQ